MYQEPAQPLAWVPTEGNDIPPLAVPLHVGPEGQLYVARALLDGETYVGTTSYSSSKGAHIRDRYGRSHDVFEYEVLTCGSNVRFMLGSAPVRRVVKPRPEASRPKPFSPRGQPAPLPNRTQERGHEGDPPPYTSPRGGWIEPPKVPPPIPLSRKESVQFRHFAQSKCFVVIDDTPSMQHSWSQTREALRGVVDILSSDIQWDGLNVRFLYHGEPRPCIKTATDFESVFNSVTLWRGDKVMTTKVSQVFAESFPIIDETPNPRPVVLLIVTDALASELVDTQELYDVIIRFSQRLNEKRIANHMFRIHLLQMGDDRRAVKPLHDFRDRITQRDRNRRILNVISYHRGRGLLNAQNIVKLLLASTDIPVEEDPDIGERQAPEAIEAQYQEVEKIRTLGGW